MFGFRLRALHWAHRFVMNEFSLYVQLFTSCLANTSEYGGQGLDYYFAVHEIWVNCLSHVTPHPLSFSSSFHYTQHHIGGTLLIPKTPSNKKKKFFNFLFPPPMSGQTTKAALWDIPASSSCSSFPQLCTVCPYMSRVLFSHRKRQFKQICCRSHQHFGTNSRIWSQSMASVHTLSDKQYSSV